MPGQKRASDATASSPRASKSAKVNSNDAAATKKPTSKASEKPASKSKAGEKPASKAKAPAKAAKAAPKSGGKGKAKVGVIVVGVAARAYALFQGSPVARGLQSQSTSSASKHHADASQNR